MMKYTPVSFDTYLQKIDFSKVTPTLRVSFELYKTASVRYFDRYRAHQAEALQTHTAENEKFQALREQPKNNDALALLQDIIEADARQNKALATYEREQQAVRAELALLAKAYTQSSDRLVQVYKGLREHAKLTRQDKLLWHAVCEHDVAEFREVQERLTLTLDQVLSPLL